ncbi:MAG: carbohydrate ABC transporter substrate-binding protein [Clostridia bacterium]|nr:carbohydrate ABC transporter substrate-binding protein [Clostridia bacterium]
MKKIICLFLALLLLTLSGCTASPPDTDEPVYAPNTESPDDTSSAEDETPNKPNTPPEIPRLQTLRLITNNGNAEYINRLVEGFSSENANVEIEVVHLDHISQISYVNDINDMVAQGKAPDIFLYSSVFSGTDFVSAALSDRLLDINELNDLYDYLDWSDYEENILEAGVFNGERKFVPIYYQVPLLVGIAETLDAYGIAYGQGTSFSEFSESIAASGYDGLTVYNMYSLHELMFHCNNLPINLQTQTAHYTDTAFVQTVRDYDRLFPGIYGSDLEILLSYMGSRLEYDSSCGIEDKKLAALILGKTLFLNASTSGIGMYRFSNPQQLSDLTYRIAELGKTPVLTTPPNAQGTDTVYGDITIAFGINAESENKEAALRFLRYALSFDAYNHAQSCWTMSIPVNKEFNQAVKSHLYGQAIDLPVGMARNQFVPPLMTALATTTDHAILDQYYDILSRTVIPQQADANSCFTATKAMMIEVANGTPIDEATAKAQQEAEAALANR